VEEKKMVAIPNYTACCIQTATVNAINKAIVKKNFDRALDLAFFATLYGDYGEPVKLLVYPEFFIHGVPFVKSPQEYIDAGIFCTIPGEETDQLTSKAKELNVYIVAGSLLEHDPEWPKHVFNTTCIIGPNGILTKYRKVNPWLPLEMFQSPHSLEGYKGELFPVADTPIGKIGAAICYDWLFPEVLRELATKGAEILAKASAYMDPWGANEPTPWWDVINRARAIENVAYVVAANVGSSLADFAPFSWPGHSQIIDYHGRKIAMAQGSGEAIVYGPINIEALRNFRKTAIGHNMLAHLRSEAYTYLQKSYYPPGTLTNVETTQAVLREVVKKTREAVYS
jgi:predicted amidohydrolase